MLDPVFLLKDVSPYQDMEFIFPQLVAAFPEYTFLSPEE
jgi:hypothetical protein